MLWNKNQLATSKPNEPESESLSDDDREITVTIMAWVYVPRFNSGSIRGEKQMFGAQSGIYLPKKKQNNNEQLPRSTRNGKSRRLFQMPRRVKRCKGSASATIIVCNPLFAYRPKSSRISYTKYSIAPSCQPFPSPVRYDVDDGPPPLNEIIAGNRTPQLTASTRVQSF